MVAAPARPLSPLALAGLVPLMARGEGRPEVVVGLLDGPVAMGHPDLAGARLQATGPQPVAARSAGAASRHGTFVAGMLSARRGSPAPAICPGCTLLTYPIFPDGPAPGDAAVGATAEALAAGVVACAEAGARVLNVSAARGAPSTRSERDLEAALDLAARRGVLVVAATGNQGAIGGWSLTRHPWVIPVTAANSRGWPLDGANFSHALGRRGLRAPGEAITSLRPEGGATVSGGTSVAAPFVTGAIALVWSAFPMASAAAVRWAIVGDSGPRRGIVPPSLDAWRAYQRLVVDAGKDVR